MTAVDDVLMSGQIAVAGFGLHATVKELPDHDCRLLLFGHAAWSLSCRIL